MWQASCCSVICSNLEKVVSSEFVMVSLSWIKLNFFVKAPPPSECCLILCLWANNCSSKTWRAALYLRSSHAKARCSWNLYRMMDPSWSLVVHKCRYWCSDDILCWMYLEMFTNIWSSGCHVGVEWSSVARWFSTKYMGSTRVATLSTPFEMTREPTKKLPNGLRRDWTWRMVAGAVDVIGRKKKSWGSLQLGWSNEIISAVLKDFASVNGSRRVTRFGEPVEEGMMSRFSGKHRTRMTQYSNVWTFDDSSATWKWRARPETAATHASQSCLVPPTHHQYIFTHSSDFFCHGVKRYNHPLLIKWIHQSIKSQHSSSHSEQWTQSRGLIMASSQLNGGVQELIHVDIKVENSDSGVVVYCSQGYINLLANSLHPVLVEEWLCVWQSENNSLDMKCWFPFFASIHLG